jgi:cytochrome c peroxidase
MHGLAQRTITGGVLGLAAIVAITAMQADQPADSDSGARFIPNGALFPNASGASQTFSATGGGLHLSGPFFQSLGRNGRSCATCHQPSDGMSVSAAGVQARFNHTAGMDPIFRTNDGSNCDHDVDVSTAAGRAAAFSLLRTRGLFRVAIAVPAGADYDVVNVLNPYSCGETNIISQYRRPLPATNLRFLSAVMWDGRESAAATGTTRIS